MCRARMKWESGPCENLGAEHAGQRVQQEKRLYVGNLLAYLKKKIEVSVTGAKWVKKWMVEIVVRELVKWHNIDMPS